MNNGKLQVQMYSKNDSLKTYITELNSLMPMEYEVVFNRGDNRIYEIRNVFTYIEHKRETLTIRSPVDLSTKESVLGALEYLHKMKPYEFSGNRRSGEKDYFYLRIIGRRVFPIFTTRDRV